MASASGPQTKSQGGVALPPTPEKMQSKLDLSIALSLATWSALTLAVQNSWGGPDSSEKRDWFAGAISDLLATAPNADVDYLEEFLLQVMNDEFDVNVEDDSGADIAAKIIGLRKLISQGDFQKLDEMYGEWQARSLRHGSKQSEIVYMARDEEEDDTDWDSEDEKETEDVDMDDGPPLVKAPREKVQPTVDEEGFTEVVSRKKR